MSADTDSEPPAAVGRLAHPLSLALLTLTFTTGLVDAVSFLGLGHVFTANMTGNVVLLGFGIAQVGRLPVLAPVVSLLAFLAGSTVGGRLARLSPQRPSRHFGIALTIEACLMAAGAILAATTSPRPAGFGADALVAVLALAMGVRNATVRRIGIPDLTTTVITRTLAALAADSPLGTGQRGGVGRRAAAAGTLLVGALVGALLTKVALWVALGLAALLAGVTYVGYVPRAQNCATA